MTTRYVIKKLSEVTNNMVERSTANSWADLQISYLDDTGHRHVALEYELSDIPIKHYRSSDAILTESEKNTEIATAKWSSNQTNTGKFTLAAQSVASGAYTLVDPSGGKTLTGKRKLTLSNQGAAVIYLGPDNSFTASATTAMQLMVDEKIEITLTENENIYARTAAGSSTLVTWGRL